MVKTMAAVLPTLHVITLMEIVTWTQTAELDSYAAPTTVRDQDLMIQTTAVTLVNQKVVQTLPS